jgi:hypothetical protein
VYDVDIIRFSAIQSPHLLKETLTPEMVFDEGYATWRGIYPGDHVESVQERMELVRLAKINPKEYVEKFKEWSIQRMDRLRRDGWRKAREREFVQVKI